MRSRGLGLIPLVAFLASGCTPQSNVRRDGGSAVRATPQVAPAESVSTAARSQTASPVDPTAGTLPISAQNTTIRFVGASLMNRQPGSFAAFDGEMKLASEDLASARISVRIDMNSVTTNIPLLTKHIKRPDFLDVEHFPTASFVSREIAPAPSGDATHVMTGDLTIHGVTRTISVPARLSVSSDLVSMDVTMTIRQSEFGMEKAARKTEDAVPITIAARLPRR